MMPKKSKHGFQYGYALEKLVLHFGKRIDEDELGVGADEAIEKALKKVKLPTFAKLLRELSTRSHSAASRLPGHLDDGAHGAPQPPPPPHPPAPPATSSTKPKTFRLWCTQKAQKKKSALMLFRVLMSNT